MKDVIRGGHNNKSKGASATNVGGLDETRETHIVCPLTINHLKRAGHTVIDGTPGDCDQNTDLKYGTDKANNNHADLFVPIHFNKAYGSYKGAIGIEIWLNPKNPEAVKVATRILNNLEALGFKNRGLKDGMNEHHLHDIRSANCTAILPEVCFCEATEDIRIYRKVGADAVAKAIADGITGVKSIMNNPIELAPVSSKPVSKPVVSTQMYRLRKSWAEGGSQLGAYQTLSTEVKKLCDVNAGYEVYNALGQQVYPTGTPTKATVVPVTRVNNSVAQLQAELNKQGFGPLVVDGFYGPKTLKACPTLRIGATGEITRWLQKRLNMSVSDQIGIFGPKTLSAVVAYQRSPGLGLDADGIVGEGTWAKLLR